ncbi:MAG: hypothetical protein CMR00_08990 [[Chlorobium] sp. 445]|nr:MAG: hypothetical protein CMR00_08990 [[Chlorobium] sp. 445]
MIYLAALKLGDVSIAVFVLIFLPTMFYDLLFETFMNGQSIGKKPMNIKVIKVDGTQPSFLSYFIVRFCASLILCYSRLQLGR